MKLAVFYHHVQEAARQTGLPLIEVLQQVRRFGIQGLDCSLSEVRQPGFAEGIRQAGFQVASIHSFFDFGRQADPDKVNLLLESAAGLGCQKVMVIPGFIRDTSDQGSREWNQQVESMVTRVAELCEQAAGSGIQASMEDFDDSAAPYANSTQLLRFFTAVPALRCAFDTGNFRFSGEDEVEAFDRLEDLVIHVHCKDRSLTGKPAEEGKMALDGTMLYSSPVGSGFMKMGVLMDRLKAKGYQGYLAIEHFGAPDYLEYMKNSATWLLERTDR